VTDAGLVGATPGLAGVSLRTGLAEGPGGTRRPGHGGGSAPGPDDDHGPGASAVPVAGDVPGPGWGLRAAFGWRAGKPESGPGGRSRFWRSLFSSVWLLYLIQPAAALFRHHGWAYATGGAVVIGTFCVVYMLVVSFWDRSVIQARAGFAALFALAIAITWAYHGNGSWIFVAAAAGLTIPSPRLALRVIGGVVACYTIVTLASGDDLGDFAATLLPVALVGLAMIGLRRQIELTRDLMQARETVARLAASEERLRLARDMHDLTGQSLSMITLKSDLAARLLGRLPQSADRDRAADEISQVADVSRQTLHDIREAISGYRRPTLAVEAITAREALEAAGIAAHDDYALIVASGTFDAGAEAVLAWCLREAVTNVIRHSSARDCWMRLTGRGEELCLDVRDNGSGAGEASSGEGTGLRGMSERLCAVGGKLELHPGPGGFRLVATVPAREPAAGPGGPGPGGPRA
jgi:two-component system, NarL family, sensor histidine kinase DesK